MRQIVTKNPFHFKGFPPPRYLADEYIRNLKEATILSHLGTPPLCYVLAHQDDLRSKVKVVHQVNAERVPPASGFDSLFSRMPAGGFVIDHGPSSDVYLLDTQQGLVHRLPYEHTLASQSNDGFKYIEVTAQPMWNFFRCDAPDEMGMVDGEFLDHLFSFVT